jgi:hypothetical protein
VNTGTILAFIGIYVLSNLSKFLPNVPNTRDYVPFHRLFFHDRCYYIFMANLLCFCVVCVAVP